MNSIKNNNIYLSLGIFVVLSVLAFTVITEKETSYSGLFDAFTPSTVLAFGGGDGGGAGGEGGDAGGDGADGSDGPDDGGFGGGDGGGAGSEGGDCCGDGGGFGGGDGGGAGSEGGDCCGDAGEDVTDGPDEGSDGIDDPTPPTPPTPGCTNPTATNFNPAATVDDGSCTFPPTGGLSCTLNASPTSLPVGGGNVTLTFTSSAAAVSASINQGIGSVSLTGTETQNVTSGREFVMTVTNASGDTAVCRRSVSVSTGGGGGGGGGSSRPSCSLTADVTSISSGDPVVLTWDNSRTREILLEDDRGNILVDSEDDSDIDPSDGSITVNPTRDTEFLLTASRISRTDECRLTVDVADDFTLLAAREREPLTRISLTEIPQTGFEAGPLMTAFFYVLLTLWSLFITYVLVIRKGDVFSAFSQSAAAGTPLGSSPVSSIAESSATERPLRKSTSDLKAPESNHLVTSAAAVMDTPVATPSSMPSNLPTGTGPTFWQGEDESAENESIEVASTTLTEANEIHDVMTALENAAHEHQVLLSSDAIRYIVDTAPGLDERLELLTSIIERSKATYPREDGWIVLNQERIATLMQSEHDEATQKEIVSQTDLIQPAVPATEPVGASSLAEAILKKNIMAAYQLIGSRPMFSLADAASDFDALYRARKGQQVLVSNMLSDSAAELTDTQLEAAVSAITSAIDGTYADEAAAVKLAIMKAVKALS